MKTGNCRSKEAEFKTAAKSEHPKFLKKRNRLGFLNCKAGRCKDAIGAPPILISRESF
jgi:hypothetical protein